MGSDDNAGCQMLFFSESGIVFSSMKLLVFCLVFAHLCADGLEEEKLSFQYERIKRECHDLACIRAGMDRINSEILRLLTERTAYVKRAGDLKSKTTRIADDRQRVADQEQKLIARSTELELPLEISLPAFRLIMENSIEFQQKYIHELLSDYPIINNN